ncbi:DUF5675 family protein [Nitrincola alkalisediminis]|uniref:DUF5675 family protein n=1 Tax=Nitrincola alkalisediminis TaxID=1366656 RepID=UPI0018773805|nr:DUF5675 family protein [Nitrincola alkalisediminis]
MSKTHLILITRKWETEKSTISEFHIPDALPNAGEIQHGYFLELEGPDTLERNQRKRIVEGIFRLKWQTTTGNRSLRGDLPLPWLYNSDVPADRRIYIHVGNKPENSDGCLLIGSDRKTDEVTNSRNSLNRLKKFLNRVGIENVKIRITSEYQ